MTLATLFAVCAMAFLPTLGSVQSGQNPPGGTAADTPAIRADPTVGPISLRVIDAESENQGRRAVGQLLTRRVVFRNVIDVPVDLVLHERTCGCLRAECSTGRVEPGQTVTITLSATVAPVMETQSQAVVYEARWTDSGTEQRERLMLKLSYSADITFSVNPDRACVTVPHGERRTFDLLVHWASVERKDPPVFSRVTSTIGDVEIRADGTTRNGALVYRVGVSGNRPGSTQDGFIELGNDHATGIRVPLRVIVIDAVRAFPGGINIAIDPDRDARTRVRTARLSRAVARVSCVPEVEGLDIRHREDRLDVAFHTHEKTARCGLTRIVFYNSEGIELGGMPVVWWTSD